MKIKSIFRKFAYWDRVFQFPDGHPKIEYNLAWRRKYMPRVKSTNDLIF